MANETLFCLEAETRDDTQQVCVSETIPVTGLIIGLTAVSSNLVRVSRIAIGNLEPCSPFTLQGPMTLTFNPGIECRAGYPCYLDIDRVSYDSVVAVTFKILQCEETYLRRYPHLPPYPSPFPASESGRGISAMSLSPQEPEDDSYIWESATWDSD